MIAFLSKLFSGPVQPYFPACPAVISIIPKLIFAQMDDIQLAKICRVSRAWNQLIQTTPALKNRLVRMKCLKAAKAVKVEEDSIFPLRGLKGDCITFKKITMRFFIATIDPRHDFAPTLKAIKNGDFFYSSDEPIFSKLVLCQSRRDLAAAKETAEKLQKKFPRLLLTVVEFESKSDLAAAQATAEHIQDLAVQSEAFLVLQNPTRAKEIAERIENETQKIDALLKIAERDPNVDLESIKAHASQISFRNQGVRYSAFYKIVKVEAKRNLEAAKVTVATEDNFEDIETNAFNDKSKAYAAIVKVEASVNLKQAKITANLIVNSDVRDKAFRAITNVEADSNFAAAKETAKKIRKSSIRCKALIDIVKKEALVNLSSAKATAESILEVEEGFFCKKPKLYRDKALLKIVEIQAPKKPSDAQKTIKTIRKSYYRSMAFLELAKHDPKHDFSAAKAEAEKITDEMDYSQVLYKIVQVEKLINYSDAIATALQIPNPYYRFYALIKIGKAAQKILEPKKETLTNN